MEPPALKRKRLPKTTPSQYELMIDFISSQPEMVNLSKSSMYTNSMREKAWAELAKRLNSDGKGPVKDVAQWKKTWSDFKSVVKLKVSENEKNSRRTGGGSPPEKLNPLYEKTAALIGKALIYGDKLSRESVRDSLNEVPSEGNTTSEIPDDNASIMADVFPEIANEEFMNITEQVNNENEVFELSKNDEPNKENRNKTPIADKPMRYFKRRLHRKREESDLTPLLEAESQKAEALNKIAETMEILNNNISLAMMERIQIEKDRNEELKKRNEIEHSRNVLIEKCLNLCNNYLLGTNQK